MRLSPLLVASVCALWSGLSSAQETDAEPPQATIVLSCGASRPYAGELGEAERREELRTYVAELDEQCEAQLEELASLVPSEKVRALRDEHREWMRGRDDYCAEVGRNAQNTLAELECLADLTGTYYDERDVELSRLHAERREGVE